MVVYLLSFNIDLVNCFDYIEVLEMRWHKKQRGTQEDNFKPDFKDIVVLSCFNLN
jgi:hypothetical protein